MLKSLNVLLVVLGLISIAGFAEVGYYQLKASVAQILLQKAWTISQENSLANSLTSPQKNIRPWPWADTWPVFKLTLNRNQQSSRDNNQESQESLKSEFIVLADTSGESLAFGPGLLTVDLSPGDIGNSIVAAHRDTHFADLGSLVIDDVLSIEHQDGRVIEFIIDQIIIVDSDLQDPILESNEARLTLVTCYPFDMSTGQTSLRYLVSGQTKEKKNVTAHQLSDNVIVPKLF